MYTLPDVWIRPPFGGKGRKVTGQLEAHANGFRYTSPKGEQLDIMYRCALHRGDRNKEYVINNMKLHSGICHGETSASCYPFVQWCKFCPVFCRKSTTLSIICRMCAGVGIASSARC